MSSSPLIVGSLDSEDRNQVRGFLAHVDSLDSDAGRPSEFGRRGGFVFALSMLVVNREERHCNVSSFSLNLFCLPAFAIPVNSHAASHLTRRQTSLEVGFSPVGVSWPASFQRASSYFAGTALLVSPREAFLHDRGLQTRHRDSDDELSRGRSLPNDPSFTASQPSQLSQRSLTTGDLPVASPASPNTLFQSVNGTTQSPPVSAEVADSLEKGETENDKPQHSGHGSATNVQALFNGAVSTSNCFLRRVFFLC